MNDAISQFSNWISTNNFNPDGLEVKPDAKSRYSVFASKDLPEDHVLFTVPADFILCSESHALKEMSSSHPSLKLVFDSDPFTSLNLCIMYELAQGPSSKFFPYFALYYPPSSLSRTPLLWNEDDFALLGGTSLSVEHDLNTIKGIFDQLVVPVLDDLPQLFSSEYFSPTYDEYLKIGVFIQSYSFSSPSGSPFLLPPSRCFKQSSWKVKHHGNG
ncbi:hypothetical protein GEMRC1_011601 [Eukaryota sp. GEM-RC1]